MPWPAIHSNQRHRKNTIIPANARKTRPFLLIVLGDCMPDLTASARGGSAQLTVEELALRLSAEYIPIYGVLQ